MRDNAFVTHLRERIDPTLLCLAESALACFHLDKHSMIAIHRDWVKQVRDSTLNSHLPVSDHPPLPAYGLVRDVKQIFVSWVSPAPLY
jgi:hypothetical protein